ncbi:hypothetical protein QYF61_004966 [Mycteria americana]|uniref:Uncharacterized protein n=1 Tax=Mycteria americana TaxID=33587 RepID=A0AAN7NT32_MYCAM|nr:hypothetical protein QYF61_004966 [Mycteria americana]
MEGDALGVRLFLGNAGPIPLLPSPPSFRLLAAGLREALGVAEKWQSSGRLVNLTILECKSEGGAMLQSNPSLRRLGAEDRLALDRYNWTEELLGLGQPPPKSLQTSLRHLATKMKEGQDEQKSLTLVIIRVLVIFRRTFFVYQMHHAQLLVVIAIISTPQRMLLRAPSSLALNVSRDGASTASLGNLFQCLTTLRFKAMTSCPITTHPCKKSLSNFPVLAGCYKVSPQPSLLQAEQSQLSQPVFTGEVLQPLDHFHGSPLDLPQQVHVLLMLGAPELDAALQVGSHKSGVEGQNHLPRPAGHAPFDAGQDTVGFLGCRRTLPGHVELLINQHPQVLLLRAALNPFSAQPVFVLGIAPTHVQDLALGLAELHEVHTGPPLKLVEIPLDGIPSLHCVNRTTQLGVVANLLRVHSIPLSVLPTKMLNSAGPNTDP